MENNFEFTPGSFKSPNYWISADTEQVSNVHSPSETLAKYDRLLKLSGHVFYEWDAGKNHLEYAGTFEGMLGYKSSELGGSLASWVEKIHPDDREVFFNRVRAALSSTDIFESQIRVLHKNGTYVPVVDRAQFFFSDTGELLKRAGVIRDISKQSELQLEIDRQAALHAAETNRRMVQFKQLLDSIPHIVWVTGQDGKTISYNQRFFEYYGLPVTDSEVVDPKLLVHPDDFERLTKEWFGEAITSLFEMEYRLKRYDGEFRWHLVRTVPLKDKEGNVLQWFGTATDIHDQKLARVALARSRAELEELVEHRTKELKSAKMEIEDLVFTLSNDLKSPLRCIEAFADYLYKDNTEKLTERGRKDLGAVLENSRKMSTLLDKTLDLMQIGRQEMLIRKVDLSKIVDKVAKSCQQKNPERKVEFNIAPNVIVKGDSRLLERAIKDLFDNAWKFTSKKEKAIIDFGCEDKEGQRVYFVRDNGAGLNLRFAEKLFGIFQRFHHSKEYSGMGIGLARVRRIIMRHSGRVWAESKVGQGSTFYFSLN
ncbi:MAG: PAS domain-containing protein [Bdellovibrionota bacterium]